MSAPHPAFLLEQYTVLANSPAVLTKPELAGIDPLTRRVGLFMVFDNGGRSWAFRDDSAPRLRPDFRITSDPDGHDLLLRVAPEAPGSKRLLVTAADAAPIGAFTPRPGPLLARCWRIDEALGGRRAELRDRDWRSGLARGLGLKSRREAWLLTPDQGRPAFLFREPEPFPYRLRVVSPPEFALDRRLLLAAALCLPALEGLTDYLSGSSVAQPDVGGGGKSG